MRVLVAEDDAALRSVLARGLRQAGYVVDAVGDGGTALDFLKVYEYELAVVDWKMPAPDGIEVIRQLRREGSGLLVLLLTARDTASDRVQGLDSGADDYLVKPFDFGELLARLRALQRRRHAPPASTISVGDLVLSPATREMTVAGSPLDLTHIEFGILEVLMRRSPTVLDRRSIALQVWDQEADAVGSNTIEVHIGRLRSKLAESNVHIDTVRGVGYRVIAK